MIVWAIADRALDIIGLASLLYWSFKATRWWYRKRS